MIQCPFLVFKGTCTHTGTYIETHTLKNKINFQITDLDDGIAHYFVIVFIYLQIWI